jgi:hypothetical protein
MEHLVIPDAQRHEAKGASTAVAGTVLKANGNGTTSFGRVAYNELTGSPGFSGYQRVLVSSSAATTQNPTAVNTPIQIEFGAGVVTANATLSPAGLLTFNTAGDFQVTTFMRFGRTTAAGQAILFQRILVNGAQALNSNSLMLDNSSTVVPFSATINITVTAGTTVQFQLYRDSVGINSGGLIAQAPSLAGWNTSPTATIVVDKYVGAV